MEAEGLTHVPSGVCDCAHGGRVVKEASIARLYKSRVISGQSANPFSLEMHERKTCMSMVTAELRSGLKGIFFKSSLILVSPCLTHCNVKTNESKAIKSTDPVIRTQALTVGHQCLGGPQAMHPALHFLSHY